MTSGAVVSTLQFAHALFNGTLFLALVYQGSLGWRNRRKRVAGATLDAGLVKRHRALGPVLAALLPAGYCAGLVSVFLNKGYWVRYPGHLAVGTLLLVLVGSAFLASRRIRGARSPWRTPHYALGLLALSVFLVQIYLGLNIFL